MILNYRTKNVTACNKIVLIFSPRLFTFNVDKSAELYLKVYDTVYVSTGVILILCSISKGFLY